MHTLGTQRIQGIIRREFRDDLCSKFLSYNQWFVFHVSSVYVLGLGVEAA